MAANTKMCAFLTMQDTDGWSIDADLAIPHLEALGWKVDWVVWHGAEIDWNAYDAVYIGTPWDYPEDPAQFMSLLQTIDDSRAVLANDIQIVRWNIAKTYLRDLQQGGAAIVPTIYGESLQNDMLDGYFERHGTNRIIIKPVVSTNATDTFLIKRNPPEDVLTRMQAAFSSRPFIVQPFIDSIQSEGEYSLFYFGDTFSHAIQKRPKRGDFRVQEEYGAEIERVEPEASLVAAADKALSLVEPAPLYARCDFVRDADGRFLVMELELIEPSMYLRMKKGSAAAFAAAFDAFVATQSSG